MRARRRAVWCAVPGAGRSGQGARGNPEPGGTAGGPESGLALGRGLGCGLRPPGEPLGAASGARSSVRCVSLRSGRRCLRAADCCSALGPLPPRRASAVLS